MGERQLDAKRRAEAIEIQAREAASHVSVTDAFERWMLSDRPASRADGGAELRRLFVQDVLTKISSKSMPEVSQADIYTITDSILARGANRMAQWVLSDIKKFLDMLQRGRSYPTIHASKSKKGDWQTACFKGTVSR